MNYAYNINRALATACAQNNLCSGIGPNPQISYQSGIKNLLISGDNRGGDANLDLHTNYADLVILSAAYNSVKGYSPYNPSADFNRDNRVDYNDMVILSGNYES